jgi:uncharacterized protein (DUF1330 family)
MSCYCLFDILEVTDPSKMENYRKRIGAVVEKFGGRYLVRGGKVDVVEGSWRPVFPVIVQFPSLEQAHKWYGSEEYRELKALRHSACKANAVFMEGL